MPRYWWRLLLSPLLYVLAGPPIIADLEHKLHGDAPLPEVWSALFRQFTAFFGSSEYDYDLKLALANGSTIAASIFFASGTAIAVSSSPEGARNWDTVVISAAILAAVSLIQVASVTSLTFAAASSLKPSSQACG